MEGRALAAGPSLLQAAAVRPDQTGALRRLFFLLPLATTGLAGCATSQERAELPVVEPAESWRAVATEDDRSRLRQWRTAWREALAEVRAAGHGEAIAREGALLEPDAALPDPRPAAGEYRCRTLKLGRRDEVGLPFVAYPYFRCRIVAEDGSLAFVKQSGSQRPIGLLFEDLPRRMVFLGTLQLADERYALDYGRDRERNMVGLLERVGEARWRLVFPRPHFESKLDVIELVPTD